MTLSCLFSGISLIVRWKRAETKEIVSWYKMFIFLSKYQVCFPGKLRTSVREQKKSKLLCWERMARIFLFLKKIGAVFFTFQSLTLVRRLIGYVIQLKTVQMKTYLLPLQYLMLILVKFPSPVTTTLKRGLCEWTLSRAIDSTQIFGKKSKRLRSLSFIQVFLKQTVLKYCLSIFLNFFNFTLNFCVCFFKIYMHYVGPTPHCVNWQLNQAALAELSRSPPSYRYRARERVVSGNLHENSRWPTTYKKGKRLFPYLKNLPEYQYKKREPWKQHVYRSFLP